MVRPASCLIAFPEATAGFVGWLLVQTPASMPACRWCASRHRRRV